MAPFVLYIVHRDLRVSLYPSFRCILWPLGYLAPSPFLISYPWLSFSKEQEQWSVIWRMIETLVGQIMIYVLFITWNISSTIEACMYMFWSTGWFASIIMMYSQKLTWTLEPLCGSPAARCRPRSNEPKIVQKEWHLAQTDNLEEFQSHSSRPVPRCM